MTHDFQTRADQHDSLIGLLEGTRRVIVMRRPDQLDVVTRAVANDGDKISIVVGDRRLCLALGPFAVAFPEVRDEIPLDQHLLDPDAPNLAWRLITRSIAASRSKGRHRIRMADAHLLDRASLQLVSYLIERGPLDDFSIIACADYRHRDIRWLDFVKRSTTAGCALVSIEDW